MEGLDILDQSVPFHAARVGLDAINERRGQRLRRLDPGSSQVLGEDRGGGPVIGADVHEGASTGPSSGGDRRPPCSGICVKEFIVLRLTVDQQELVKFLEMICR